MDDAPQYGLIKDRLGFLGLPSIPSVEEVHSLVTKRDVDRVLLLFWEAYQKLAFWHETGHVIGGKIWDLRKRIIALEERVGITDPATQTDEYVRMHLARMECSVCHFFFYVTQEEAKEGCLCPQCTGPCTTNDIVPQEAK